MHSSQLYKPEENPRRKINLYYTNYNPNKKIALSLKEQFRKNGLDLILIKIDYYLYITNHYEELDGIFLDIIGFKKDINLLLEKNILPLLRCQTNFLINEQANSIDFSITKDGYIDWLTIETTI